MKLTSILTLVVSLFLQFISGELEAFPCNCDAKLARLRGLSCNQWCEQRCLKYYREEMRYMDLVNCSNSTVT